MRLRVIAGDPVSAPGAQTDARWAPLMALAAALLWGLSFVAGPALAGPVDSADGIVGVWRTKTGGYVQVYRHGDIFDGAIVGSASGRPRYDKNNPNPDLRDRRLLGVTILHGLSYKGHGVYEDGRIYDPNSGKTYHAKATLKGPDTLDARGYIGFSLFGKTQTWHRIDPHAPNVHPSLLHHPVGAAPQSGS